MNEMEAFYENVAEAARYGRKYEPLQLLAMKAARAALAEGNGKGGELEFELELESEAEAEWETSPAAFHQSYNAQAGAPIAVMEHFGHAASEAESNGEAFAFLAPLVPWAMKAALPLAKLAAKKLLPKAVKIVAKVAPKLIKGVNSVARTLRGTNVGKPLVRALPRVVRKTATDIARQVSGGANVTPQSAVQTLARNTAQIIGNPRALMSCVQRSAAVDRQFHNGAAAGAAPCVCQ
jgi:hypothetical protein